MSKWGSGCVYSVMYSQAVCVWPRLCVRAAPQAGAEPWMLPGLSVRVSVYMRSWTVQA